MRRLSECSLSISGSKCRPVRGTQNTIISGFVVANQGTLRPRYGLRQRR